MPVLLLSFWSWKNEKRVRLKHVLREHSKHCCKSDTKSKPASKSPYFWSVPYDDTLFVTRTIQEGSSTVIATD